MGKFRDAITPNWIKKYLLIYREQGFKAMLKAAGWKIVLLIFILRSLQLSKEMFI